MKIISIIIILFYSLNIQAEDIVNECGDTVEEFISNSDRCFERHGEYTIESRFDTTLNPVIFIHDELNDEEFNKLWVKDK
jgi:hypothetical protein